MEELTNNFLNKHASNYIEFSESQSPIAHLYASTKLIIIVIH